MANDRISTYLPEKSRLPWEQTWERKLRATALAVLNRSLDAC